MDIKWPGTPMKLVLGAAIAGFVLRALPLIGPRGPLGSASFDEGVYFSAAGLFVEGVGPYCDFVFLHPPGIVLALGPFIWFGHHLLGLDYAELFTAARWLASLVGAINVILVGYLAYRWRGTAVAGMAAALYATFPPAVAHESKILLKPFLNRASILASLGLARLRLAAHQPSWTR